MRNIPRVSLIAAAVVASACGGVASAYAPNALDLCVAHQPQAAVSWGPVSGVAGAFSVTAKELADWQETRHSNSGIRVTSRWRSAPIDLGVTVCYYDGAFAGFPNAGQRLPYDRIVVIVGADGKMTLDAAGPRDYVKVERPTRK